MLVRRSSGAESSLPRLPAPYDCAGVIGRPAELKTWKSLGSRGLDGAGFGFVGGALVGSRLEVGAEP